MTVGRYAAVKVIGSFVSESSDGNETDRPSFLESDRLRLPPKNPLVGRGFAERLLVTCRLALRAPLRRVLSTVRPSGPSATVCERPDAPGAVCVFRFAADSNRARTPPALTHSGFWAGRTEETYGTEDTLSS